MMATALENLNKHLELAVRQFKIVSTRDSENIANKTVDLIDQSRS